jgi:hypothetical protein
MKVLILGLPRSGTTSLIRGIKDQGYTAIIEPFNDGLQNATEREYPLKDFHKHKNLVVKNTTYQKPRSFTEQNRSWKDFNMEFMPLFDKFIFLDRRIYSDHFKSIVNLWYRVTEDETTMQAWSDEDVPKEFTNGFIAGGGAGKIHKEKEDFRALLSKFGFGNNITYYEDLYGSDREKSLSVIESWGLKDIDSVRLNQYLHPSKKLYRGTKKAVV